VHHVGILYDQFMMHGQRNIKLHFNCPRQCNDKCWKLCK